MPELLVSDMPDFFFGAEAAGPVFCPFCGTDIDHWFYGDVGRWGEGDRRVLTTVTPCCNPPTSLNDLDFDGEQGFGCVAMKLWNPGHEFEPAELQQLEAALGVIWRYI